MKRKPVPHRKEPREWRRFVLNLRKWPHRWHAMSHGNQNDALCSDRGSLRLSIGRNTARADEPPPLEEVCPRCIRRLIWLREFHLWYEGERKPIPVRRL